MNIYNKHRSLTSLSFYPQKISIDNLSIGKKNSYGTIKSWSNKYKKAVRNTDNLYDDLVKVQGMLFVGNKIVNVKYDTSSINDTCILLYNMWFNKFKKERNRNMNTERLYKIETQRLKSSLKNIEKNINNDKGICSICFEKKIDRLCYPCGHLCMCSSCIDRIKDSKCPVCRKEVKEYVNVFHCN
jgi:rubrerythrin